MRYGGWDIEVNLEQTTIVRVYFTIIDSKTQTNMHSSQLYMNEVCITSLCSIFPYP